jgi:hypothetical protein
MRSRPNLLQETLDEETGADEKLTELARASTNEEALEGVEPGHARGNGKNQRSLSRDMP